MTFITSLGYSQFFFAALLIIIFGIDFKKGFVLVQVLLLTAAVTELLKNTFALPRPFHIDSNVIQPDIGPVNDAPFANRGARSFFSLMPQEVIDYYRDLPQKISYGLPSGHTSSAVTFWGSLVLLFENKYIKYISLLMIVLIPFSRLYLGRHFPADIIGGYILGILIIVLFYLTFFNRLRLAAFLSSGKMEYNNGVSGMTFNIYLIVFPILFFLLLPDYFSKFTGYWLGLNSIFIFMADYQTPILSKRILKRIAAVITASFIFFIVEYLIKLVFKTFGYSGVSFGLFVMGFIVAFAGIFCTIAINRKLKLYT
jgi:membrane-associated phospholipid phosphatase